MATLGGKSIFETLGIDADPSKAMDGYAALAVWTVAVVFLILCWAHANDPADTDKQKKYNAFVTIVLLGLILGMFFTLRLCA